MILKIAVEVGLVDGIIAATTPRGLAISTMLSVSLINADGFHGPEMLPDVFGGKSILLSLVLGFSKAGFLIGESPKARGVRERGRGHRFADRVDLGLIKCRDLSESTKTRLLPRRELPVVQPDPCPHNNLVAARVRERKLLIEFSTYCPASTFRWP